VCGHPGQVRSGAASGRRSTSCLLQPAPGQLVSPASREAVEDIAGDGGKDDHTPDNAGGLQFTRCPGVCRRVGGCADAGPGTVAWAVTTMNVGIAWKYRITGDRRANIDKAIACYQDALAVRTHDANAVAWATTVKGQVRDAGRNLRSYFRVAIIRAVSKART
jgi:hypothetical protein